MGLFTKEEEAVDSSASEQEEADLRATIAELNGQLAKVLAEFEARKEAVDLEEEITELKRKVTEQQIALDRVDEDKARTEREIEHKLGLHRTQVEAEREQMESKAEADRERAVAEARIAVREENLTASTERLEEQAKFQKDSMEREMASLRALTGQILERLPTFKFNRSETIGHPQALKAGDEDGDGK